MKVLIAVISPAATWVMPRHFVDRLRRQFPQHTFLDAWDRETLRRLLPEVDAAKIGIVPTTVTNFLWGQGNNYLKYYGRENANRAIPMKSWLE